MKLLYIFFSICFTSSTLLAQDYKRMLSERNEWQFTTCFQGNCDLLDVYFTDGDTLVNNKTHKILDGYHYISRSFLLREVVEDKQVFLTTIINGNIREYLMYDFSLEVGDEMDMKNPITPFPEDGGMFTLTDIVELPLEDGELYKHYYFDPSPGNTQSTWKAVWVEGVGSLSIVTAPGGKPNFDEVGELSCSFANGEHIYANLERIGSCSGTLGTESVTPLSRVELYIENESLIVRNAEEITDIKIYDVHGRLISSEKNNQQQNFSVSTAHFKRGIYIVIATNSSQLRKTFRAILN